MEYVQELDIRIAREQLSETDEVRYYLGLGCLCGIQVLRSTLKEEIVRYLFWERIMRIILQKNIIMQ